MCIRDRNYSVNPIIKGGCPLLNAAVDADDQYSELSKTASKFMNRSVPVSYTHLDVYKRQGVPLACEKDICIWQILLQSRDGKELKALLAKMLIYPQK